MQRREFLKGALLAAVAAALPVIAAKPKPKPKPIDFGAPYSPANNKYLGRSIQVQGTTIGRFVEWGNKDHGLRFVRAEVWVEEFEVAFPDEDPFLLLVNPDRPFMVDEVRLIGRQLHRQYRYEGCFFRSATLDTFSRSDGVLSVVGELTTPPRIRIV